MDTTTRRSTMDRVAVPIEPPPFQPPSSLVPLDVWETWQKELHTADADDLLYEVGDADFEPILSTEAPVPVPGTGLAYTAPADFEVALFALSQIPLFAKLGMGALDALAQSARQGELPAGEYLFREEARAESFYVVLDGALEVLRRTEGREVALRHLGSADPVGLFGVLGGQRRAACIRAIGDATLLQLPASALQEAMAQQPELQARVARFYQERLLEGFVGSSRLFADVDSIARARIIGRFAERRLKTGEALVQPGEVTNLLAVVISGTLHLESRPKAGEAPSVFDLVAGEFLAFTSAFSGAPCRMRVYAKEPTVLAMMGHRELSELLRDYPILRSLNVRLPQVAEALDRDVWCGHTAVPGL